MTTYVHSGQTAPETVAHELDQPAAVVVEHPPYGAHHDDAIAAEHGLIADDRQTAVPGSVFTVIADCLGCPARFSVTDVSGRVLDGYAAWEKRHQHQPHSDAETVR